MFINEPRPDVCECGCEVDLHDDPSQAGEARCPNCVVICEWLVDA